MSTLHRIWAYFFAPRNLDPSERYREQILRYILPLFIILGPLGMYFLLYDTPTPLPAPLTPEIIILTWYIPYVIAIIATYRGNIQEATWAFMLNWFISNQRGVILDGYWDMNLRMALVLELVFVAFMFRRSRWLFIYAIAQMLSFSFLAITLEGTWYSAPEYLTEFSSLSSPYVIIIPTIIFHILFFIVLRVIKFEFDRRQKSMYEVIDTLEDYVLERTSDLEIANQKLTELADAKDAFVSNVSHELRTPIASILLTAQTLKRVQKNDNNKRHDRLIRDTKRLNNMIESFLLLSRLDQNQITIDRKQINLNNLVQTLVDDRVDLAEQKKISLSHQASEVSIHVLGDFAMIEQLLSVLITNALNYTLPDGDVTVQTSINTSEQVEITVTDTGIGIDAEELPKLFERFFRANADIQGTGLGLAIAQEIVTRHDGHIRVESDGLGHGARFIVTLPSYTISDAENTKGNHGTK